VCDLRGHYDLYKTQNATLTRRVMTLGVCRARKYVKGAEDVRIVDAAEQRDKRQRKTYDELKTRVSDTEVEIAGSLMMDVKQLRVGKLTRSLVLAQLPS